VRKIVIGSILNPISDKKCQSFINGAMVLKAGKDGAFKVENIGPQSKVLKELAHIRLNEEIEVIDLSGKLIMPSFFDMHFHWVQDDVREMPKDSLLTWLEKYTFPTERKFNNKAYAKKKAKFFFQRLTNTGTLGGACYSSIHEHALDYAFDNVVGDFIIGNVLMTQNSPKFLTQTKNEAIKLAGKLSAKYKERYALTPRFAIATDPETMKETSKVAKKNKSFIQTHLSENKDEISFVKHLYSDLKGFKKDDTYTEIYKRVGMLGSKTIMGHAIHLDKSELETLAKTKTTVAHCPTSNAPIKQKGLGSGLFDFKLIEKNGIRWALASDIGGGPFLSMFDVMQSFVAQNNKAKVKGASYTKALFRSTVAGAEILKLGKKKGNLEIGKEANFIVVDMPKLAKDTKVNAENILERLIVKSSKSREKYDAYVKNVYFKGHRVDDL